MADLTTLATTLEQAGENVSTDEGRAAYERAFGAYYDALATALGYTKTDDRWLDEQNRMPSIAMMESRLAQAG